MIRATVESNECVYVDVSNVSLFTVLFASKIDSQQQLHHHHQKVTF